MVYVILFGMGIANRIASLSEKLVSLEIPTSKTPSFIINETFSVLCLLKRPTPQWKIGADNVTQAFRYTLASKSSGHKVDIKITKKLARNLVEKDRNRILNVMARLFKMMKSKKRLMGGKLSMGGIEEVLEVAEFQYLRRYVFNADGPLSELPIYKKIMKYTTYYNSNLKGKITDVYNRKIIFSARGSGFLYDGHKKSGKFRLRRGQRLPWIKEIVKKSREIFLEINPPEGETTYMYAGHARLSRSYGRRPQHFKIVVREDSSNKKLYFVTAWYFKNIDRFYRALVKYRPFIQRGA